MDQIQVLAAVYTNTNAYHKTLQYVVPADKDGQSTSKDNHSVLADKILKNHTIELPSLTWRILQMLALVYPGTLQMATARQIGYKKKIL